MPNTKVNAALRDQKLLAVPAGDNVVRLLPPLTVTEDEIRDRRSTASATALQSLARDAAGGGLKCRRR